MPYIAQSLLFKLEAYSLSEFYKCNIIIRSVIKHKIAQIVLINAESLKEK